MIFAMIRTGRFFCYSVSLSLGEREPLHADVFLIPVRNHSAVLTTAAPAPVAICSADQAFAASLRAEAA